MNKISVGEVNKLAEGKGEQISVISYRENLENVACYFSKGFCCLLAFRKKSVWHTEKTALKNP